jgi:hypothetical protein
MSGQVLVKIIAVVWSTAALVAIFIGLPMLLAVLGVEVNVGLIVSALAACGSFTAAGVALWVATSDRRKRQHERDAEDEAQAKLVIVCPRRPLNPLELQILVTNYGTRAIVDLVFVGLVVEGHHFDDLHPTTGPFPVIAPPAASVQLAGPLAGSSLFSFDPAIYGPTHPYYIAVRGGPNEEPQTITGSTMLTATIRWTDASGKTWERRGSAPADASRVELETPVRKF